jgi:hypothetical protein
MRYINARHVVRFASRAHTDALRAADTGIQSITDDKVRRKYIDDHAKACSDLRHALWVTSYGKCWYSEVLLEEGSGEVEHFRPKKQVWKSNPPHGGYWWRAFDLKNLRLAHRQVNIRREDFATGEMAGKGCYFPLRDEGKRATDRASERYEESVLLDPVNAGDCRLLCFDSSSGVPIPRYTEEQNEWLNYRARKTIEYYHLDESTWNYLRHELMCEVNRLCDLILEAAVKGEWAVVEQLVNELQEDYIDSPCEFSRAAIQAVCEKGLLHLINPLPGIGNVALGDAGNVPGQIPPAAGNPE